LGIPNLSLSIQKHILFNNRTNNSNTNQSRCLVCLTTDQERNKYLYLYLYFDSDHIQIHNSAFFFPLLIFPPLKLCVVQHKPDPACKG
jgi:hypothetical protein